MILSQLTNNDTKLSYNKHSSYYNPNMQGQQIKQNIRNQYSKPTKQQIQSLEYGILLQNLELEKETLTNHLFHYKPGDQSCLFTQIKSPKQSKIVIKALCPNNYIQKLRIIYFILLTENYAPLNEKTKCTSLQNIELPVSNSASKNQYRSSSKDCQVNTEQKKYKFRIALDTLRVMFYKQKNANAVKQKYLAQFFQFLQFDHQNTNNLAQQKQKQQAKQNNIISIMNKYPIMDEIFIDMLIMFINKTATESGIFSVDDNYNIRLFIQQKLQLKIDFSSNWDFEVEDINIHIGIDTFTLDFNIESQVYDIVQSLQQIDSKNGLDVSNVQGFHEDIFNNLDKSYIQDLKDVMSLSSDSQLSYRGDTFGELPENKDGHVKIKIKTKRSQTLKDQQIQKINQPLQNNLMHKMNKINSIPTFDNHNHKLLSMEPKNKKQKHQHHQIKQIKQDKKIILPQVKLIKEETTPQKPINTLSFLQSAHKNIQNQQIGKKFTVIQSKQKTQVSNTKPIVINTKQEPKQEPKQITQVKIVQRTERQKTQPINYWAELQKSKQLSTKTSMEIKSSLPQLPQLQSQSQLQTPQLLSQQPQPQTQAQIQQINPQTQTQIQTQTQTQIQQTQTQTQQSTKQLHSPSSLPRISLHAHVNTNFNSNSNLLINSNSHTNIINLNTTIHGSNNNVDSTTNSLNRVASNSNLTSNNNNNIISNNNNNVNSINNNVNVNANSNSNISNNMNSINNNNHNNSLSNNNNNSGVSIINNINNSNLNLNNLSINNINLNTNNTVNSYNINNNNNNNYYTATNYLNSNNNQNQSQSQNSNIANAYNNNSYNKQIQIRQQRHTQPPTFVKQSISEQQRPTIKTNYVYATKPELNNPTKNNEKIISPNSFLNRDKSQSFDFNNLPTFNLSQAPVYPRYQYTVTKNNKLQPKSAMIPNSQQKDREQASKNLNLIRELYSQQKSPDNKFQQIRSKIVDKNIGVQSLKQSFKKQQIVQPRISLPISQVNNSFQYVPHEKVKQNIQQPFYISDKKDIAKTQQSQNSSINVSMNLSENKKTFIQVQNDIKNILKNLETDYTRKQSAGDISVQVKTEGQKMWQRHKLKISHDPTAIKKQIVNKTVLQPNKNTNLNVPPPAYQRMTAVSPAHNISYQQQTQHHMKSPSDQTLLNYNNNSGRQEMPKYPPTPVMVERGKNHFKVNIQNIGNTTNPIIYSDRFKNGAPKNMSKMQPMPISLVNNGNNPENKLKQKPFYIPERPKIQSNIQNSAAAYQNQSQNQIRYQNLGRANFQLPNQIQQRKFQLNYPQAPDYQRLPSYSQLNGNNYQNNWKAK